MDVIIFTLIGCAGDTCGGDISGYTGEDGTNYIVDENGQVYEGQTAVVQAQQDVPECGPETEGTL